MTETLTPESADAACDILRECTANRRRVQPAGAQSQLRLTRSEERFDERSDERSDSRSDQPSLTVSAAALTVIEDYEPEDLTITVGAGVTIAELQQTLGSNRQWLALDPPASPEATIGGLVATASVGPLRAKYGTPRDHVLGLDIVTGDGRALRFGGQVVKNVAGYDMVRPIVGSRGSLGLITRVSLRLRPMPEVIRTLAIPVTMEDGLRLAWTIENLWPIAALELLDPVLASRVTPNAGPRNAWILLVRIDGYAIEVAEAERRIGSAATGVTEVPSDTWGILSRAEAAARISKRFAGLPSALPETVQSANRWADLVLQDPTHTAVAIHGTAGIVRAWSMNPAAERATVITQTDRVPVTNTGSSRIRELNRGIKDLFDPAGILPDLVI